MADQYGIAVLKAWTKKDLARQLDELISPYPPASIISIQTGVDFQFFWPWQRNWSQVVLRVSEEPPERDA